MHMLTFCLLLCSLVLISFSLMCFYFWKMLFTLYIKHHSSHSAICIYSQTPQTCSLWSYPHYTSDTTTSKPFTHTSDTTVFLPHVASLPSCNSNNNRHLTISDVVKLGPQIYVNIVISWPNMHKYDEIIWSLQTKHIWYVDMAPYLWRYSNDW